MTTAVAKTETVTKELKPHEAFEGMMLKRQSEFMKVLPSHISFDKFQRTVMTAVITEPKLLGADRSSLMVSCLKAAQDGLLPDKRDAALVIFNSKVKTPDGQEKWTDCVQYMPMYSGILKKVRQSEELSSVAAHVVYEKDKFHYVLGDEERVIHEPYFGNEERGEIVAAYCIAKLKDGTIMREVMTKQDIEKIRKKSKSGNDKGTGEAKGIWKEWYEEMAKKTVFRRLAKWLPQTADIVETALKNDDSMQLLDAVKGSDARTTIDGTHEAVHSDEDERPAILQQVIDQGTGEIETAQQTEKKKRQVSKPYTPISSAKQPPELDAEGYPVDTGEGDKEPE